MTPRGATYGRVLALLLALVWSGTLRAQTSPDTLGVIPDTLHAGPDILLLDESTQPLDTSIVDSLLLQGIRLKRDKRHFQPDPIRAMWLGLVFPGAGQVYNRKFWKLPVIYGGFLGCAYALTWNNQMLRDYSQAYIDIMDSDPNTKSYENMLPMGYSIEGKETKFQEIFKNKKDHFRKYRDMSIFAFAGVYLISVIDAYVDAELSSFDISRDLSLQWQPAVIPTGVPTLSHQRQNSYGVAFCLSY